MAGSDRVLDCFLDDLLRREVGNVIEIQLSDRLEADIRKLHDCLLELSRIESAWVSAGSVAEELGRILAKKERRSGESPDPAQNKDTALYSSR